MVGYEKYPDFGALFDNGLTDFMILGYSGRFSVGK
jgi:hypothetical protein